MKEFHYRYNSWPLSLILILLLGAYPSITLSAQDVGIKNADLHVCPTRPLNDSDNMPQNLRAELSSGKPIVPPADFIHEDSFLIKGKPNTSWNWATCSKTSLELEIAEYPTLMRGAPTHQSNECMGKNCGDHIISIKGTPGRPYRWQARIRRTDFCTINSVCEQKPYREYVSSWVPGFDYRFNEVWLSQMNAGESHFLAETVKLKGKPLGEISNGIWTMLPDEKYTTYGSVEDSGKKLNIFSIDAFMEFGNRYNATNGSVVLTSRATRACKQKIEITDVIRNSIEVIDEVNLAANEKKLVKVTLKRDLRNYLFPRDGIFDNSGWAILRISCVGGSQPFEYGMDYMVINSDGIYNDQERLLSLESKSKKPKNK